MMRFHRGFAVQTMTSVSRILLFAAAVSVAVGCSSALTPSNADGEGNGGVGGSASTGRGGAGASIGCFGTVGALDRSQCAATYDAQAAKAPVCDTGSAPGQGRTVRSGSCGSYQLSRTARDGTFYLVIDCIYDGSGNLYATRFCSDTGCQCGGQQVDLSACADGTGLGPDRCAATDGGTDGGPSDGTGSSCGYWTSVDPPPAGTTFACPIDSRCRPTYPEVEAAQADGGTCGSNALSVEVGACNSKLIWRVRGGLWFETCVYETDGTLVGSEYCTDTGCFYAGQALGTYSCADGGVTTTVCPGT